MPTPKPPPHAVRAVNALNETNSRRPSVIRRLRRLPGRKSRPVSASAGAPSGQPESLRATDAVVAAVCMVSMELAEELPGVTEVGKNEAVAPEGRPLAVSVTGLENVPFCAVAVMVYCAEPPGCTVCAVVVELTMKLGGVTAVKLAVALSGAFMVMVVDALAEPATLPVQLVNV